MGILGGLTEESPRGSGVFVRLEAGRYSSVVFLGFASPNDETMFSQTAGTGFFISHDKTNYLVTAKHVAGSLSCDAFALRFTDHQTLARIHRVDAIEKWYTHPSEDFVDIAVVPMDPPAWAHCEPLSAGAIVTDHIRETRRIGAGDITYIVGMHKYVIGQKTNVPVVHTGHIASMVDGDRIPWADRVGNTLIEYNIEGYLIQNYTLKGTSGSPVFVRGTYQDHSESPPRLSSGLSTWLLGVWKGSYQSNDEPELVTSGIGVATPATKLLEILESEELKEHRKEI